MHLMFHQVKPVDFADPPYFTARFCWLFISIMNSMRSDWHELQPLIWTGIKGFLPLCRDITLPFSRIVRKTCADIPHDYTLQILYDDLQVSYAELFVFRGSASRTAACFAKGNFRIMRTGAEAFPDLPEEHMERKTVQSSLVRGEKRFASLSGDRFRQLIMPVWSDLFITLPPLITEPLFNFFCRLCITDCLWRRVSDRWWCAAGTIITFSTLLRLMFH